jgi:Flp pilus assembly pilin Flp
MQIISFVLTSLLSRIRSERGQDLIEYAMLSALIALAIIAVVAVGGFTGAITNMISGIGGCIDFVAGGCDPI